MSKLQKFKYATLVSCTLAISSLCAMTTHAAEGKNLKVDSIPYTLETGAQAGEAKIINNMLSLTAFKGSDLFVGTDATKLADTALRVLFQPKGDFIFSAKVNADFKDLYDGGALVIYSDPSHWAKFLFETEKIGEFKVTSTVARPESDNSSHGVEKNKSVYLKIAHTKDMYVFYTSADGVKWNYARHFGLKSATPIKIGFSSQSPIGEKFTATFSDIKYREATFKDFWQGE
ncbi:MAG: DUF1349 domain-containing protein [Gammaproteobacteria bacterium]|nr:MAG: DUF1349 domain-containing protein [Gammaproteobacteria bacterium]